MASLALTASYCSVAIAAVSYEITDLGTLGGVESRALGINDAGQIVGRSTVVTDMDRPFLYSNGVMTNLGTIPGGTTTVANAMNTGGVGAGYAYIDAFKKSAVIYQAGAATTLSSLPGGASTEAHDINTSGAIVGFGKNAGGTNRALMWLGGVRTELGTLGTESRAYAINDAGQVARDSFSATASASRGFIWQNGVMTDVGTLGGTSSHAWDINASGVVVGEADVVTTSITHAFIWNNGVMTDIGTVKGGTWARGEGINAAGTVVGVSHTASSGQVPFVYDSTSGMADLNDLIPSNSGWELWEARDINTQIVGVGTHNGAIRAYLLTPVPEPSMMTFTIPTPNGDFVEIESSDLDQVRIAAEQSTL